VLEAGAVSLLGLLFSEAPVPDPLLSDAGSFFEAESPFELSPLELSPFELSALELSAVFLPEPLPAEAARESVL
jgi:hypothetical protein